jgi:hypothetical protein
MQVCLNAVSVHNEAFVLCALPSVTDACCLCNLVCQAVSHAAFVVSKRHQMQIKAMEISVTKESKNYRILLIII